MTAEPQGPPLPDDADRWHAAIRAWLASWWPLIIAVAVVIFSAGVVSEQASAAKAQALAVEVKLDTLSAALKPVTTLAALLSAFAAEIKRSAIEP
jgi:hypothetical protein